jgi:hypothetical protein
MKDDTNSAARIEHLPLAAIMFMDIVGFKW